LATFAKNRQYIATTMQYPDDLQGLKCGIINNDVVRKGLDRPKSEWKMGDFLSNLPTKRAFGQECASLVNFLFYALTASTLSCAM